MDWLWTCLGGGGKHGVQPPRICAGKSPNSSSRVLLLPSSHSACMCVLDDGACESVGGSSSWQRDSSSETSPNHPYFDIHSCKCCYREEEEEEEGALSSHIP